MTLAPAELPTVVGEHALDLQAPLGVERQRLVVQYGHRSLRLLRDMQEAKREARVGVHHGVQVDLAHPFKVPNEEGVLVKELPGPARLYVSLPKAGVLLFDEGHLFCRELDLLFGRLFLQLEPALIASAQALFVQDVLYGRGTHRDPFQLELIANAVAPPRRMREAQGD